MSAGATSTSDSDFFFFGEGFFLFCGRREKAETFVPKFYYSSSQKDSFTLRLRQQCAVTEYFFFFVLFSFFVLAFWFICMFIGEFKKKVWKTKLENQNQKRWLIVTQIPFLYVSPPFESCQHFSGRSVAGIRNSHHVVTRWIFFFFKFYYYYLTGVCVCVYTQKRKLKKGHSIRVFLIYISLHKKKTKICADIENRWKSSFFLFFRRTWTLTSPNSQRLLTCQAAVSTLICK